MAKDYFLGIDGGGTKTAAVLLTDELEEIARAVSGPSNHYSVGQAVTETSLREAIHQALVAADLKPDDIAAIGLGMAGVDRPSDREIIRAILSRIAHFPRAIITNDAETALVGGVGRRHGTVLIVGTGAIAYGVNARGESRRADGWGYIAGDEGSALWIGQEGLRAVTRAHDGRGPATALEDILMSHLGLAETGALVTLIYAGDFGVPHLAGLAPLVSQAAQAGDEVARSILQDAGRRVSETLGTVIRGLNMTAEPFEVVLMGGVLRAKDLVWKTVVAALADIAPQARVIEPRYDAATGAALLAQQRKEQISESGE
jgi:N-acetylglucosamine kinase-like BadF-type ATPase